MNWKDTLKNNVTTIEQLREYLHLSAEDEKKLQEILCRFPMRVTRYYLSLVDWDHYEEDPIFRMCVPSVRETDLSGTFDTSGESFNTKLPGLQHKYHETALILTTSECAMYCRHCFRKRLVGLEDHEETATDPLQAAEYVRAHREISNVLLSGGDSFLLDNEKIGLYLRLFAEIPHLDFIRFGTRTPVTFPMRITEDPELIKLLKKYGSIKQIYVVTHFNHPREITPESIRAVTALRDAGVILRNQTVLLRGVNDDPAVLGTLLRRLTSIGVIPYYIFQCRPVTGVKSQFQVPFSEGYAIVEQAKSVQNGQGKCLRYALSHPTGKIEILGPGADGQMLFKYHQSKNDEDAGRIFSSPLAAGQAWLD